MGGGMGMGLGSIRLVIKNWGHRGEKGGYLVL